MKLHSIVSKALQKSSCTRIPGIFGIFVCSTTSLTNLIFCPMYLPFRKPVWSGLIKRSKTFSNLVAMTFDAILQSTFSNVIGRQFGSFRRFASSFGRRDITPLLCDIDISPFTYATLKQFSKSCPSKSKKQLCHDFQNKLKTSDFVNGNTTKSHCKKPLMEVAIFKHEWFLDRGRKWLIIEKHYVFSLKNISVFEYY